MKPFGSIKDLPRTLAQLNFDCPLPRVESTSAIRLKTAQYRSSVGGPKLTPKRPLQTTCAHNSTSHADSRARHRLTGERVLVDLAVLHDQDEVFARIRDQLDVCDWITVDQKQIRQRAFLHNTQLAAVGAALS